MPEAKEAWDYCTITFSTYHNVGGGEHAGLNYGLLWFEANAKGANGRYEAGKSNEVPFAQPAEGYPQENHPAHATAYRELTASLKKDGWEPVSGGGSGWWEQRFRREASNTPESFLQKIRSRFLSKLPK